MIYAERFAYEVIGFKKHATELQLENEELRFKVAMYKAQAFHKWELADKLSEQIDLNFRVIGNGEFDGFCYCYNPNAVYRSFKDMYKEGILNEEEYDFCKYA